MSIENIKNIPNSVSDILCRKLSSATTTTTERAASYKIANHGITMKAANRAP
jgi:hypothetical protein